MSPKGNYMLGLVNQHLIKSNNLSNECKLRMFTVSKLYSTQTNFYKKNLCNATLCRSAVISALFAVQLKITVIESAISTGRTFQKCKLIGNFWD